MSLHLGQNFFPFRRWLSRPPSRGTLENTHRARDLLGLVHGQDNLRWVILYLHLGEVMCRRCNITVLLPFYLKCRPLYPMMLSQLMPRETLLRYLMELQYLMNPALLLDIEMSLLSDLVDFLLFYLMMLHYLMLLHYPMLLPFPKMLHYLKTRVMELHIPREPRFLMNQHRPINI